MKPLSIEHKKVFGKIIAMLGALTAITGWVLSLLYVGKPQWIDCATVGFCGNLIQAIALFFACSDK